MQFDVPDNRLRVTLPSSWPGCGADRFSNTGAPPASLHSRALPKCCLATRALGRALWQMLHTVTESFCNKEECSGCPGELARLIGEAGDSSLRAPLRRGIAIRNQGYAEHDNKLQLITIQVGYGNVMKYDYGWLYCNTPALIVYCTLHCITIFMYGIVSQYNTIEL